MHQNKKMKNIFLILAVFFVQLIWAQKEETKVKLTAFDGAIVVGYVDQGGFVNFTGPSVKLVRKPYSISFGCLPTLRIKEDKVAPGKPKNPTIFPTLGMGLTFMYKHLAIQIPTYYNAKTATTNGEWNVGFGVGYKF